MADHVPVHLKAPHQCGLAPDRWMLQGTFWGDVRGSRHGSTTLWAVFTCPMGHAVGCPAELVARGDWLAAHAIAELEGAPSGV